MSGASQPSTWPPAADGRPMPAVSAKAASTSAAVKPPVDTSFSLTWVWVKPSGIVSRRAWEAGSRSAATALAADILVFSV